MLDQSLSALFDDLEQRGQWGQTLVVVMGEFGRTPRINGQAGRDHWGLCQSVLLAGGGIQGGQVYGASDRIGAYPSRTRSIRWTCMPRCITAWAWMRKRPCRITCAAHTRSAPGAS